MGKLKIHMLRKSCGQNWVDHLPVNVVKKLMGYSNIATPQEFYTQVDSDHDAKAARAIQRLIDNADGPNRSNKTDARMTPETILHQIGGERTAEWSASTCKFITYATGRYWT